MSPWRGRGQAISRLRAASFFGIALLAIGSGCATTLSTMQTANPVERGHVQVGVGMGLYAPLGPIGAIVSEAVDQAKKIHDAAQSGQPYQLSPDDQQKLLTAGIGLAVFTPGVTNEIMVRTGVFDQADVGLRYSVNAVRIDGKYRFFHSDDGLTVSPDEQRGFDVAGGVAISKYLFTSPITDALQYVNLGGFSRFDVEVPLYASWERGRYYRFYLGPKYLFSRTSIDAKLVNTSGQASNITGLDLTLPATVDSHFVGTSVGMMLGYRWAFVILELTGGYTFCKPLVLGQPRDLGGVTLYPAIGLLLRV